MSQSPRAALAPLVLALLLDVGCATILPRIEALPEVDPMAGAPRSAATVWTPVDAAALPAAALPAEGVAAGLSRGGPLGLPELIDVGLRSSPKTRETWAVARARAAAYAESRAAYYPAVTVGFEFAHEKAQTEQGKAPFEESPYGPYAELSFLLLDFGGRSAAAEAARQALVAANWQHNQSIQDLILRIAQAYYLHIAARAQLEASEADLAEAEASYEAADERFRTGIGILADALQARATVAQIQLVLADRRGLVETTRGNLATALGVPANTRLEVAEPTKPIDFAEAALGVDRLIETAVEQRPDLIAARAEVLAREEAVDVAKSAALPTLDVSGAIEHQYFATRSGGMGGGEGGSTDYIGAVNLSYPLFAGFGLENAIRRAEADLEAAQAGLVAREENVISQVWNSFYDFQTSLAKVKAAKDLLASAQQSYDVSAGSYRAGVGDIVELLQAQSLLARARAEIVNANTGLYLSLTRLIHDTGLLLPAETGGAARALGNGGS